ncbi:unnamed protein product [marine sediment metagenome]|uniref:Uncharacterized protein n=1 Tax=marine sediment metagenome TaxID=412755 RepID=X1BXF3_9ZZZZ
MGLEISGDVKSIRWLKDALYTAARLKLEVEIEKNGTAPDCAATVYSIPDPVLKHLRIRIWIDNRAKRLSSIRIGTAHGNRLIEVLRKPDSICDGNQFHTQCYHKLTGLCGEWYHSKPDCERYSPIKKKYSDV